MAIQLTDENAAEEALNTWTHGTGFLLSLPAGVVLIRLALEALTISPELRTLPNAFSLPTTITTVNSNAAASIVAADNGKLPHGTVIPRAPQIGVRSPAHIREADLRLVWL